MKLRSFIFSSKAKQVAKTFLSIVLVSAMVATSVQAAEKKENNQDKYKDIKVIGNDTDILFFGNSHIRFSVYPMELWQKYGMTGIMMAYNNLYIPESYWVFENSLDYCKPKLVVLDLFRISENGCGDGSLIMSSFPASQAKLRAAIDLDSKNGNKFRDCKWMDTFVSYGTFHDGWKDELKASYNQKHSAKRGADFRADQTQYDIRAREPISKDVPVPHRTISMDYVDRMIERCQEEGIEILLVNIPQAFSQEAQPYYNYGYEAAKKYGIKYLDLYREEGLYDFDTDLSDYGPAPSIEKQKDKGLYVTGSVYDALSHLNISGGTKVSNRVADFIHENYDLEDHRGDSRYAYWQSDYDDLWLKSVDNLLNESQSNFCRYVITLKTGHYDSIMYFNNTEFLKDERIRKNLLNLGAEDSDLNVSGPFLFCLVSGEVSVIGASDPALASGVTVAGSKVSVKDHAVYLDGTKLYEVPGSDVGCQIKSLRDGKEVNSPKYGSSTDNFKVEYTDLFEQ